MKKILIAMLILMSATAVEAKTSYTDYTFTGYVETKKEDDELYRYEEVTINKYYKLVEIGEYLEEDNDKDYPYVNKDDFITEHVKSLRPSTNYKNDFKVILKNQDNYINNKIQFSNIENYESLKIKEIEIYQKGKKKSFTSEYDFLNDGDYEKYGTLTSDSFDIKIPDGYMNDTEVRIYYETDEDTNVHVFYKNVTGLLPLSADIVLNKDSNKVTINSLKTDKFLEFLTESGFSDADIICYYEYDTIKYKHYYLEKEYLEAQVESIPEDYTYNPNESYTMYKEYKREKIESADSEENDKKNEVNKDDELSHPKEDDKVDENKSEENFPPSKEEEKPSVKDPISDIEEPNIKDSDNKEEDNKPTEKDETLSDSESKDEEVKKEEDVKNKPDDLDDSSVKKDVVNDNLKPTFTVDKKSLPQKKNMSFSSEVENNLEEKSVVINETPKNLNEKNSTQSKDDSKEDSSKEYEKDLSPFTLVGIILLFLSVVFDVIYLISVKHKKE